MLEDLSLITLFKKCKPPYFILSLGVFLNIINSACSLIFPLLIKDQVEKISTEGISYNYITIIIILFVIEIVSLSFSIYFLLKTGNKVVFNLRKKIIKKLFNLNVKFYEKNKPGELVSRVTNDTSATASLLSSEISEFLSGILSIIGALIILFILDGPLTLVLITAVPLTFIIVVPISKLLYRVSLEQQERIAAFAGSLTERISEIRLIKANNTEEKEIDGLIKNISGLYNNGLKRAKIEAIFSPLLLGLISLIIIGIIGYGAYRVTMGYLSAGDLIAFILYLFQVITPIGSLSRFISNIQSASGASERLFDILAEKEDLEKFDKGNNSQPELGLLKIKNLYFSYGAEPLLQNISVDIKPNTLTAIVGPSGSGKTTLFYILERFYNIDKGEITLNDIPYQEFDLKKWRELFSYVSQDTPILAGTIRSNILYGVNREVSESELITVSKMANCYDFICDMPESFDTYIGERGVNLSGGQKQRIAIARAFLRDTPFLLLDEITASLDSSSENMIHKSLRKLMNGRTTIAIAHRISTIKHADQIIVIDKGKVSGIGNHSSLTIKNKLYKSLVDFQHIS
ncbi:ABC transporter ATP-binding protein [Bacillus subtilis]|nr:ABC transporter ATP-binding protein [Bacillus subtilis]